MIWVGRGEGKRTGYELLKTVYKCFPMIDFVPSLSMMDRYWMKIEDQCMTNLPFSPFRYCLLAIVSRIVVCCLFPWFFLEGFIFLAGEYS